MVEKAPVVIKVSGLGLLPSFLVPVLLELMDAGMGFRPFSTRGDDDSGDPMLALWFLNTFPPLGLCPPPSITP